MFNQYTSDNLQKKCQQRRRLTRCRYNCHPDGKRGVLKKNDTSKREKRMEERTNDKMTDKQPATKKDISRKAGKKFWMPLNTIGHL